MEREPFVEGQQDSWVVPESIIEEDRLEMSRTRTPEPKELLRHQDDVAVAQEQAERLAEHPSKIFELLTRHIPEDILAHLDTKQVARLIKNVEQEFERTPGLAERYEAILIEGDEQALLEKTGQQLQHLRALFYGPRPLLRPIDSWKKRTHLKTFQTFVQSLRPVRYDKQLFHVYESPRQTGEIRSYGAQDLVAQADTYVYASFDQIRHFMSRSDKYTRILNDKDPEQHIELVMQDAANVHARYPDRFVEMYLNNIFDYRKGKELLAVYLASVFQSPEEAAQFLARNNDPHTAQRWENQLGYGPDEREKEIRDAMMRLRDQTGIEPPLSLEVRFEDQAKLA